MYEELKKAACSGVVWALGLYALAFMYVVLLAPNWLLFSK